MRVLLCLSLLVGVLSGCGGGGGAAAVAPEPEVVSGPMRLQGQVRSPVIAANGSGLSVFGFAGTISKAYWTDTNPTLAETEIVFYRDSMAQGRQLVACEPDGTNLRAIANLGAVVTDLRVSPDGVWLYFAEGDTLKRVSIVGGPVTTVLPDVRSFALTPSGTRVFAYRPGVGDVVIANINGSGVETRLPAASTVAPRVVGCVSEQVGVLVQDYSATSPIVERVALAGAINSTMLFYFIGGTLDGIDLGPGRDVLAFRYRPLSSNSAVLEEAALTSAGANLTTLRDDLGMVQFVLDHKFSPDGQAFVGVQWHSNPNEYRLVTLDRNHNVIETVFRGSFNLAYPSWAPSPTFRTFVGAGNYAAGAAALLYSDLNDRTPSVVLADANPRSSMNLTRVSGDNDGTIIYEMTCDALTKLHYTKSNSFAQVGVIGSLTGLKGAIVAFNATTGRVNNVITFTKKPSVSRSGEKWVVEGDGIAEHYSGDGERRPTSNRVVIE